jgi:hypothetical protein
MSIANAVAAPSKHMLAYVTYEPCPCVHCLCVNRKWDACDTRPTLVDILLMCYHPHNIPRNVYQMRDMGDASTYMHVYLKRLLSEARFERYRPPLAHTYLSESVWNYHVVAKLMADHAELFECKWRRDQGNENSFYYTPTLAGCIRARHALAQYALATGETVFDGAGAGPPVQASQRTLTATLLTLQPYRESYRAGESESSQADPPTPTWSSMGTRSGCDSPPRPTGPIKRALSIDTAMMGAFGSVQIDRDFGRGDTSLGRSETPTDTPECSPPKRLRKAMSIPDMALLHIPVGSVCSSPMTPVMTRALDLLGVEDAGGGDIPPGPSVPPAKGNTPAPPPPTPQKRTTTFKSLLLSMQETMQSLAANNRRHSEKELMSMIPAGNVFLMERLRACKERDARDMKADGVVPTPPMPPRHPMTDRRGRGGLPPLPSLPMGAVRDCPVTFDSRGNGILDPDALMEARRPAAGMDTQRPATFMEDMFGAGFSDYGAPDPAAGDAQ